MKALPSRRRFLGGVLLGTASAAVGAVGAAALLDAPVATAADHQPGAGAGTRPIHGGGHNGATFRAGGTVDHAANGFNPSDLLRDFDYGRVSTTPQGRTLREWEVVATDRDVEVAPGVRFPAWTFNSRIPGPTLRCTQGDLLRVRFVNGSAHPHTMHFHGIQVRVKPLARIVAIAAAGVDPKIMGIGPVPAVKKMEQKYGLKLAEFDLIELNEAFAAQVIACDRELHMDPARLNVNGGAIALGHPIGCTGTRITVTLLHEMRRRGSKHGLATLCVSGGMGMALALESV